MRFVHLSDTHIHNLKYIKDYREIFERFYKDIKEKNPDLIVHSGDLCHSKTNLSPEYVDLATEFLQRTSEIAPLYIIAGNHDGILKNVSRQNAIDPIVKAINSPRISFLYPPHLL